MKKYFLLLLIFPTFTLCQHNEENNSRNQQELKKSAEIFVTQMLKYSEQKNWEAILKSVSEDGLLVSSSETSKLKNALGGYFDYIEKSKSERKVLIDSLSTEVFGKKSALVTARYKTSLTSPFGNSELANLDIFLLEKTENDWKIVRLFPQTVPANIQ